MRANQLHNRRDGDKLVCPKQPKNAYAESRCWFDENSSSNLKLVLTGGNDLQSKHEDMARTERVGSCVGREKGTSSFVSKN